MDEGLSTSMVHSPPCHHAVILIYTHMNSYIQPGHMACTLLHKVKNAHHLIREVYLIAHLMKKKKQPKKLQHILN